MPPFALPRQAARSAFNLLRPHAAPTPLRAFSTTAPQLTKTIKSHLLPDRLIPPYPYGERRVYKQSNRGLYGSARIRFGNVVAPRYKNKSHRFWRPNIHVKHLYSPSLRCRIKIRLTLRVLKTIDREGGIENYLLKSKPARIKELGPGGWNLRWLLMQSDDVQRLFNKQREEMGLETKPVVDHGDLIQYALDFATPGALSMRSKATLEGLKAASLEAAIQNMFPEGISLGEAEGVAEEDVTELTDEMEAELIQQLDATEIKEGAEKETLKL